MNRNWYALLLVVTLIIWLSISGWFIASSMQIVDQGLVQASALAEKGDYVSARRTFCEVAAKAEKYSHIWTLLVRRSLVDQLNQTLATIPFYASYENKSDLDVETARARTQAEQIRKSFFSWF